MGPLQDGWTTEEVAAAIARDNPEELVSVPIAVALDPPSRVWAERILVRLAAHPDSNVRANALLGFGHLARIYRYLNRRVVGPIIEAGLEDPDPSVRGKARTAAEDIEWFLGWVLRGREQTRHRRCCPT